MKFRHVVPAFIAGALFAGFTVSAQAASVTIADTYWGGTPTTGVDAAIVGGPEYDISSMTAERNGQDLTVSVFTNYVNHIGIADTQMGSLFIGSGNPGFDGVGPEYTTDTYVNNPTRFSYIFDYNDANVNITGGSGDGKLYAISGPGDVQLSFGDVRRANQGVDRADGKGTATGIDGKWTITTGANGSVSFSIANFFNTGIDSTSLVLAWAMTCANDIIISNPISLARTGSEVPLPAGAWLLVTALAGMGALGRHTKRAISGGRTA
jgi:hypothetical protein